MSYSVQNSPPFKNASRRKPLEDCEKEASEPEPIWDYVSAEAVTRLYETVALMPGMARGSSAHNRISGSSVGKCREAADDVVIGANANKLSAVAAPTMTQGSRFAMSLRMDGAICRDEPVPEFSGLNEAPEEFGRVQQANANPAPPQTCAAGCDRFARIETLLSTLEKQISDGQSGNPCERTNDTSDKASAAATPGHRHNAIVPLAIEDLADRMDDLCLLLERMIEDRRREKDEFAAAIKNIQTTIAVFAKRQTETAGAEDRSIPKSSEALPLPSAPIFRGRVAALTAGYPHEDAGKHTILNGHLDAEILAQGNLLAGETCNAASAKAPLMAGRFEQDASTEFQPFPFRPSQPSPAQDEVSRGDAARRSLGFQGVERAHLAAVAILFGVACLLAAAQATAGLLMQ